MRCSSPVPIYSHLGPTYQPLMTTLSMKRFSFLFSFSISISACWYLFCNIILRWPLCIQRDCFSRLVVLTALRLIKVVNTANQEKQHLRIQSGYPEMILLNRYRHTLKVECWFFGQLFWLGCQKSDFLSSLSFSYPSVQVLYLFCNIILRWPLCIQIYSFSRLVVLTA